MKPEDIKEIENKILELEKKKDDLSKEFECFKKNIKLRKNEISAEMRKLKNKIRWYKYANEHYNYKDYSESPSVQLFGKRAKDLTPEEKREYQRIMTRKSRQKKIEK